MKFPSEDTRVGRPSATLRSPTAPENHILQCMWFLFFLTAAVAIAGEFRTSRADTGSIGSEGGGVLSGEFTTSLGDKYPYTISAITTDSLGNTYVVGSRQLGGAAPGSSDVFVSKLDSQGDLFFTDTFAGKGVDTALPHLKTLQHRPKEFWRN